MATDDERREVAERLRELELGVIGTFIPTGELAENILKAIDYGRSGAMTPYGCLADLIDPDTTSDTTKSAEDTTKAPTSSDTAPTCDRDALLALADELDDCGLDGWSCGPVDVGGFARRIREACGEVVA